MERTLQVLNELERDGVLSRYAIGDAMGATFYIEPLLTFDLDIIMLLPETTAGRRHDDSDHQSKLCLRRFELFTNAFLHQVPAPGCPLAFDLRLETAKPVDTKT